MSKSQAIETDVLILGSGPAGISAALHLLQLDPAWSGRMLVLEKAAHPRPKLCGGGLTRLGLRVLSELGFSMPLPIPQAQVDEARLVYRGRTILVRGQPQFTVFHRPELDAWLAAEARRKGVDIHENEPALDLKVHPDHVLVTTPLAEYRARVLVGADGSKGVARRMFARRERRTRVARLLEVIAPAGEAAPALADRFAVFDFSALRQNLQGYTWEFPARVGGEPACNLGVYDARLANARPRADLPAILHGSNYGPGEHLYHPQGHPIHWFSPRARLSLPRLLLAGDAAGADPLFGEGIAPALGYGRVVAAAVQHAFHSGDFSFGDYSWQVLSSAVGRYLMVRWLMAQVCYRLSSQAWFMHGVWSLGSLAARLWPTPPVLYRDPG